MKVTTPPFVTSAAADVYVAWYCVVPFVGPPTIVIPLNDPPPLGALVNVHAVPLAGGVHVTVARVPALTLTEVGLTLIGTTFIEAVPAEAPKAQLAANVTPLALASSAEVVWYVATYGVAGLVASSVSCDPDWNA